MLIFVCAGQLSEYGVDKVKSLLSVINERYYSKKLVIRLIGSNEARNSWVNEYFSKLTQGRGRVEFLPRMNESMLFSEMVDADYGLVVIRDPAYDFGTKVYDYIALGKRCINPAA